MKPYLMHPDRDFEPDQGLPPHWGEVRKDLGLDPVLDAMSAGDPFLHVVAEAGLARSLDRPAEIAYRQDVLADWVANEAALHGLYQLAIAAIEGERRVFRGFLRNSEAVLRQALEALSGLIDAASELRSFVTQLGPGIRSDGVTAFAARIREELDDEYLAEVRAHIKALQSPRDVLISARLGPGNKGLDYKLRRPAAEARWSWLHSIGGSRGSYTVRIADRDEAGALALAELRDRGLNLAANAMAQSTDHVLAFFRQLRTELAFYIACLNLRARLAAQGTPFCQPESTEQTSDRFSCRGIYDVGLSLLTRRPIVGNDLAADERLLVVITGANQGGKSTLLRAVGQAQLMMQCGMFVPAESFRSAVRPRVLTHFKRGEDPTMQRGKLEEELERLSLILDVISPNDMLLFNEPLASTTERDGSDIADALLRALADSHVSVFLVTHLYELAQRLEREPIAPTLFLRAERRSDGQRTFRLLPASPLSTSYGPDLYGRVFGVDVSRDGPQVDCSAKGEDSGRGASETRESPTG